HLVDIDRLAGHVVDAHVDLTLEPEFRADGGDGDAVLTRTGLGNDPLLSHPAGQQDLPQGVVDLVRAGVAQVLALEPDLGAAGLVGEAIGPIDRRRPSAEGPREVLELTRKRLILVGGVERGRQLLDGGHQGFRDVLPAVAAKAAALIRRDLAHDRSASRTAATKARSFAGSLRPGSASTPLQTSTAQGWSSRTAPSTLSGVSPPDTTTGY